MRSNDKLAHKVGVGIAWGCFVLGRAADLLLVDRLVVLLREDFLPRSVGFRLLRMGLLGLALFFRVDERVVLRFWAMRYVSGEPVSGAK
ncbi:MAG: hypothetical protein ACK2T5_07850 [Anaerolineales bacterium]